jgi:alcohol dehydrogenase class IV
MPVLSYLTTTQFDHGAITSTVKPPAAGVALDGLYRSGRHIEPIVPHGNDRDARWQMMMAATEGAMAFI